MLRSGRVSPRWLKMIISTLIPRCCLFINLHVVFFQLIKLGLQGRDGLEYIKDFFLFLFSFQGHPLAHCLCFSSLLLCLKAIFRHYNGFLHPSKKTAQKTKFNFGLETFSIGRMDESGRVNPRWLKGPQVNQ